MRLEATVRRHAMLCRFEPCPNVPRAELVGTHPPPAHRIVECSTRLDQFSFDPPTKKVCHPIHVERTKLIEADCDCIRNGLDVDIGESRD